MFFFFFYTCYIRVPIQCKQTHFGIVNWKIKAGALKIWPTSQLCIVLGLGVELWVSPTSQILMVFPDNMCYIQYGPGYMEKGLTWLAYEAHSNQVLSSAFSFTA